MRNLLKLTVAVCVFAFTNTVLAQETTEKYERNFKFGVGLNTGAPLNDPYKFNIGGDVRVQYNISETYSISFTTGYNSIFVDNDGINFNYVPVKVGYKTFLFSNEFYIMGEIGAAISVTKEYSKSSMIFAPSIGYAMKNIDLSIRYENLKDIPTIKDNVADKGLGQIMFRIAYGFDL